MTYPHERTGIMRIEQTTPLGHFHQTHYVTVEFSFWHHYIPRASLTITEGLHNSEEIEQIMEDHARARDEEERTNLPKLMSFTCRAESLVHLAKEIIKTYEKQTSET